MTEERFLYHIYIIREYLKENLSGCNIKLIDPSDDKDAQGPTRSFLITFPKQDEKRIRFTRDFIQQNPADLQMALNRLSLADRIMNDKFVDIEISTHSVKKLLYLFAIASPFSLKGVCSARTKTHNKSRSCDLSRV